MTRRKSPAVLLLLFVAFAGTGSHVAIAAAEGFPHVFRHDFRGRALPPELTLFNVEKDDVLSLEPRGVRIQIPNTWIHPGGGVGVITTFGIKGDFEATTTFEILHAELPPAGYGAGVEIYAVRRGHGVGVSRLVQPDGLQVVLWCTVNHNGDKWTAAAPCTDTVGRLRLRRKGTTVYYLWAAGLQGDDFEEKQHLEFGDEEIDSIRVTGLTSRTPSNLDVRLLDFDVRWRPDSGGSRWWSLAAVLSLLVIGIGLAAQTWFNYLRRRRGQVQTNR